MGTGKIYWLASYPKSGNTWMRILLTNYLRNGEQPADINKLDNISIASAREVFDDVAGVEASDLTQDEIDRYRPFVYEQLSNRAEEAFFLKVHDAFTYTSSGYPLISKRATAGVLYLVRNPLDVAVSFAHHGARPVSRMVECMGDPDYCSVGNPNRLHNQLHQRLLTWSGHVASWLDEPDLNTLVVRYEDLKQDTVATFSEVVRFCGFDDDPARVAKAVEFSKFEQVKKQEEENSFEEKMPFAESFFRKGVVGSWREGLTPELVEKLIADHREVMMRLGYLTGDGKLMY